ncbi:MAG: Phage terminase large subunit [Verrucomicrobiales bacterium]|nr:Phage terminase large subunit [Verrucomicrobiales bacterium]
MAEGITIEPEVLDPMDSAEAQEFAEFLSRLCEPPSDEPTEHWAEKHVLVQDGPFAGSHWRLQFTPFIQYIFAAMRKTGMKRVTLMFSAQYLKTTAIIINFLRNAKEDPSDVMWVMADADHIGDFVAKRLMPYIENCEVVAPLVKRTRGMMIQFEAFNLLLRGSNSKSKLQSDPIRFIYCDERREWRKGAIDILRKRLRTFPNALEISAGTAGNQDDELHTDYDEGSQTRAHINCLKCGHSQPIRFGRDVSAIWKTARECGGFVGWSNESNPGIEEITRPDGVWNYEEVKKHVRFECENPKCRARYTNNQKYELLRTMHPHDYNPNAPKDHASFGGSAFEAIWESCDWDKLVEEFLKAVEQARKGNIAPMIAFITETLGEPWMDRLGVIQNFGFLEARKQKYDFDEVWPEEKIRFMAADRGEAGGEHYWWVVRAFALSGKSRLIAYGKASSKAELEQQRKDYRVDPNNSMLDTGHETQDCYRFCLAHGWKAFKGEDRDYYLVVIRHPTKPNVTKTVRRVWLRSDAQVYNAQTKLRIATIKLFLFGNHPLNELLAEFMTGLIGEWTIPTDVSKLYFEHMTSERREKVIGPRGQVSYIWKCYGENHLRDCERMIKTAAIISKTINATQEDHSKPKPQNN